MEIIHYCDGSYIYGATGGVARYDYHILLAFPKRIFIKGPQQKQKLLNILSNTNKNFIVITDNHLACDIPNNIKVFLVHHGCAMTTAKRNPGWGEPYRTLCTEGQRNMLTYRDQKNTTILSISQSCTDDFTKYFGDSYLKFKRIHILHASELNEEMYKTNFNKQPLVLGNWRSEKKGQFLIPKLKENIKNFTFNQLQIVITNTGIEDYNKRKQDIYLKHDIYLQISNSEGNSYATLDALLCGMVVVASNVGLFYKDVPEDCFVKLEWEKNGDAEYVQEKLEYAWEHREELSKNARRWYMENCRFCDWKKKMNEIVSADIQEKKQLPIKKIRFIKSAPPPVTFEKNTKEYFKINFEQFTEIFLPNDYIYQYVDENQAADLCIYSIQFDNENLLRDNEFNIFFSVENLAYNGRKLGHYKYYNKFGKYGSKKTDLFIMNDESKCKIQNGRRIYPIIYSRISYFNKLKTKQLLKQDVPFSKKKFALITSRNMHNSHKKIVYDMLSLIGKVDTLDMYPEISKCSCYNSPELLSLYNNYKFIITFENSNSDGYITEKIFNAFLAKSIPIYDGDPNIGEFININSFIKFDENVLKKVMTFLNNEKLYNHIINYDKINEKYKYIKNNYNIETKSETKALFWQYPVITEKKFYEQNQNNSNYIGIPWANIQDQRIDLDEVYEDIIHLIDTNKTYYTCCQHIIFRKFIPLWNKLNIKTVYAAHKQKYEDIISGITIKPCPLYAVNYENETKNMLFRNKSTDELINMNRDILYSFIGAYQPLDYMSDIRPKIFTMEHSENCYIKNIGKWHFDEIVFDDNNQNIKGSMNITEKHEKNTIEYNELLLRSRYTLAPSGSGPNSIRFWEALAVGSIPILLSDTLELPDHPLWDDAILVVLEKDLEKIPEILNDISLDKEHQMRQNCINIYKYFRNNYVGNIL